MTFLPRTFANDVQMQHFSFSLLIVSIGVLFLPVPCVATHIDETVFRLPAEHIQAPGGICVAGCKIAGTAVCDLIRFPFDLSALPCQLRFHLMQPQQVTVPTAGKLKTKYRCFVFIFSSCVMRWNSYITCHFCSFFHFVIICDKLFYEFAECPAGSFLLLPHTHMERCVDLRAEVFLVCHWASSFPS